MANTISFLIGQPFLPPAHVSKPCWSLRRERVIFRAFESFHPNSDSRAYRAYAAPTACEWSYKSAKLERFASAVALALGREPGAPWCYKDSRGSRPLKW